MRLISLRTRLNRSGIYSIKDPIIQIGPNFIKHNHYNKKYNELPPNWLLNKHKPRNNSKEFMQSKNKS